MGRSSHTPHRAHATLVVALLVAGGALAASSTAASGQESPEPAPTTPETTTSTTSTTAPPVTVDLGDGDIGVLPPGAEPPPAATPPPPGDEPMPAEGELEVPEELPVVILPDPAPGLNAALAEMEVTRAREALAEVEEGRRDADAALREAFARRSRALAARRDAGTELLAAKALVDELAVNAVMFGNIAEIEPVLGAASLDHLRDLELSSVVGDELLDRLDDRRTRYDDAVDHELDETRRLGTAIGVDRLVRAEYLRRRTELDAAIREASEARRNDGPTVLGDAALESADLVAWYRRYYSTDPAVAPIERIIDTYLQVGEEEGVAGDIAFAQAILETGGFRSGHSRKYNFAGIGAYDHCSPHCSFSFSDLRSGVRAHIHLLRAYAEPGLTSAELASTPNPLVAPERVGVRGCCERWAALTGVWATDPNYDRKVLGIYRLMVETARERDRARV